MSRLSDADLAVYLRNAAIAIGKLAAEHEIDISIYTNVENGYVEARFGSYEYNSFSDIGERYEYRPNGEIEEWCSVTPEQIRLNKEPLHRPE